MATVELDIKTKVAKKLNINKIPKEKIKREINSVRMVDGKFIASFEITNIPKQEITEFSQSTYRSFQKIFDTIEDFSTYANNFFKINDKQVLTLPDLG